MIDNPLPNSLPGAVCAQFRQRGGRSFGTYYFRFWRDRGKLKKQYVPLHLVEQVRELCSAHRLQHARQRQEFDQALEAVRDIRRRTRSVREVRA